MANEMFRLLKADEIECRVAQALENGVSILLYKDARVDQNILDETVGAYNWQRRHSRDNANCEVGIWDKEKQQWIWKEDTGTESQSEAQKGLASDSFKRACFNWGIGRELYSAPFIWVDSNNCKIIPAGNGKFKCKDRFSCKSISYNDNREIDGLVIVCNYKDVFTWGKYKNASAGKKQATTRKPTTAEKTMITQMQLKDVHAKLIEMGSSEDGLCRYYDLYEVEQMNVDQYADFCARYEKWRNEHT